MRVQYLSDVHCEFHDDNGRSWAKNLPVAGDVLVCAGDIVTHQNLTQVYAVLCQRFPFVIAVAGNHEYYGSNRGKIHNKFQTLESKHHNFKFLNNDTVEVSGQRFVGTTLWWRTTSPMVWYAVQYLLNDFRRIEGYRNWVEKASSKAEKFLQDTVMPGDIVVTHHAPSTVCRPGAPGDMDVAYYNHLEELILDQKPSHWVFGHTHEDTDVMLGDTRIVSCPMGYTSIADLSKFGMFDV